MKALCDKYRTYIVRKAQELRCPINGVLLAMRLARNYPRIRMRRDRRGDLLFDGLQDNRVTWNDRMYVESFYLDRVGHDGDKPPYETVWGAM